MNSTDTSLIKRGERAEIDAWESVWNAATPAVAKTLGLSKERAGGVLALQASRVPWWFFNRVIGLGINEPADLSWLENRLDRYADAGMPYGVSLCDGAHPANIASRLEAKGLRKSTALAKMMRSTADLPGAGIENAIREVGVEDARLFAEVATRGYGVPASMTGLFECLPGRPGWRFYLSYDAGEPAGTGGVFVEDDVAWIGFGSTVPERRGKGLHRAMMLHRMHVAADLGCRWLVTETDRPSGGEPAPSFHNMVGLGFEQVYDRPNYTITP